MFQRGLQRTASVCLILGAIAVALFRTLHGDLPASDAAAALRFIAARPYYASIHLGTIIGVLIWAGGLVILATTFRQGAAATIARLGVASALVGTAIFSVDFSIDGFGGQSLAAQWAAASPSGQIEAERAAATVFGALHGTSLVAIAILWGLPTLLFALAVVRAGYPRWLGWSGLAVGAITCLVDVLIFLQPDLMPGVVLYGILVLLVQAWNLALGAVIWLRARQPYPVRRGLAQAA
jgi:hypothetical protein